MNAKSILHGTPREAAPDSQEQCMLGCDKERDLTFSPFENLSGVFGSELLLHIQMLEEETSKVNKSLKVGSNKKCHVRHANKMI